MKRSRSAFVSVLAFFRIRTIRSTEPINVAPDLASMVTSPRFVLGWPNFPATKKFTEAPPVGTGKTRLLEKGPAELELNRTAPPVAPDVLERRTLTVADEA